VVVLRYIFSVLWGCFRLFVDLFVFSYLWFPCFIVSLSSSCVSYSPFFVSVLVGGDAADLERARHLLQLVGSTITHLGPLGAGQRAKAVNQVLVAGSYAAVAEALALGHRLGLPMPELVSALQEGAAGSWALRHRAPTMLEEHFPLGFKLELHRKDLGIALEAAKGCNLPLPITQQVAAMEDTLMEQGHGQEDVSALLRWFKGY
jgi:3-hydroxyisobutyrate dehydrogenase-like beta-hydroxyacid dehydrogenase